MAMHGAGSWNSPIVISDDEDEATVELELERRLASPREDVDYYDDWDLYEDLVDERLWPAGRYYEAPEERMGYGYNSSAQVGEKRKREASGTSASSTTRSHATPLSSPAPLLETRNARKKRRKRERKEAEALAQSLAPGPSSLGSLPNLIPGPPPPLGAMNGLPRASLLPPLPQSIPLPLKPMALIPPPPTFPKSLPQTRQLPSPNVFMAEAMSQAFSIPTYGAPLAPAPFIPSSPMLDSAEDEQPAPQQPKRQIGRPRDEDPDGVHGAYSLPQGTHLPNTKRILVMELLPKKFRNHEFVLAWATGFCPNHRERPRVYMNSKSGRALIAFPTEAIAQTAWESQRMFGKGKEHIRVWWYTGPEGSPVVSTSAVAGPSRERERTTPVARPPLPRPPIPMRQVELEEGEIEEHEDIPPMPPPKSKQRPKGEAKQKARQKQTAPPPLPGRVGRAELIVTEMSPPLPPVAGRSVPLSARVSPSTPAQRLPPIPVRPNPVSSPVVAASAPTPFALPPTVSVPAAPREQTLYSADWASSMDLDSDDGIVDALLAGDIPSDEAMLANDDADSIASSATGGKESKPSEGAAGPSSPVAAVVMTSAVAASSAPLTGSNLVPIASLRAPLPKVAPALSPLVPVCTAQSTGSEPSTLSPATTNSPTVVATGSTATVSPAQSAHTTPTPPLPDRPVDLASKPSNYSKLDLLARQKQLAEMIARTKEELATRSASRSGTATPATLVNEGITAHLVHSEVAITKTLVSSAATDIASVGHAATEDNSATKEESLRRLVLGSKKAKASALAVDALPTTTSPSVPHVLPPQPDSQRTQVGTTLMKTFTTTRELETEVDQFLESCLPVLSPSVSITSSTPTTPSPAPMSEKAILVAKQRILERQIKRSKALMERHATATTKEEKDAISREMKASRRLMEEEMQSLTRPAPRVIKWPDTATICVIELSDDEDD